MVGRHWLLIVVVFVGLPAHADWTVAMTSPRCSEESRQRVGGIAREQIEHAVRRAEASIAPPAPVGTLACLGSLMQLPLGTFAPSQAWTRLFGSTLDPLHDASGNLLRRFCAVAEREWRRTTSPLTGFVAGTGTLLPGLRAQVASEPTAARPGQRPAARPAQQGQAGPAAVDGRQSGKQGIRAIWHALTGD